MPNKTQIQIIFFTIFIFLICCIPGPHLLGSWESFNYFYAYESINSKVSFKVSTSADIGDPTYGFVSILRPLLDSLDIYPTVNLIRLPSVFYGLGALLLFYCITKKFTDKNTAFISTTFLAINPLFHFYCQSMTVVMVSSLAFLALIFTLQSIKDNPKNIITWIFLGISISLISIHYGAGRIFSFIYFIFFVVFNFKLLKKITLKNYLWSIISFIVFITLLDIKNLKIILNPIRFFFPKGNEISGVSDYGESTSLDLISGIKFNIEIVYDLLLNTNFNYHIDNVFYLLSDYRFELINSFPISFLVMVGTFLYFKNLILGKNKIGLISSPNIIALFAICGLGPLFSLVLFDASSPSGLQSTLSNYRLFYLLFPLYFLLSYFIYIASLKFKNIFIILWLYSFFGIANLILNTNLAHHLAIKPTHTQIDRSSNFISHLLQHDEYHKIASKIKLATLTHTNKVSIIKIDRSLISEALIQPVFLPYIRGLNYHSSFISLYLNSLDVQNLYYPNIDYSTLSSSLQYSQSSYDCSSIKHNNQDIDDFLFSKKIKYCVSNDCRYVIFGFCDSELNLVKDKLGIMGLSFENAEIK
jgi:hypothetical protein